MLTTPLQSLEARAAALARRLPPAATAGVAPTRAAIGGGAFPGIELPSAGVVLAPPAIGAATLAQRLRRAEPPVVGIVAAGRVVLDVRTILPEDESAVVAAVTAALE